MSSPESVGISFEYAITKVKHGEKITRFEWPQGFYGVLRDSKLQLHKPDGKFYDWIINEGDLLADDWGTVHDH